jgi:molybdopterin-guanine dinucleotide biosynthesis protein A
MGRDKADLPHPCGSTFLEHAVDRLRSVCDQVAISASSERSTEALGNVTRIDDPVAYRGPIVGVAAALCHASRLGFAGCLFTPVDVPELSVNELQGLTSAWRRANRLVCGINEPSGQLEPLIAIYPSDFATSLSDAATGQDRSLYRWLERHDPLRIMLSSKACRNINTPDDL